MRRDTEVAKISKTIRSGEEWFYWLLARDYSKEAQPPCPVRNGRGVRMSVAA